jgi:hypothetical protein
VVVPGHGRRGHRGTDTRRFAADYVFCFVTTGAWEGGDGRRKRKPRREQSSREVFAVPRRAFSLGCFACFSAFSGGVVPLGPGASRPVCGWSASACADQRQTPVPGPRVTDLRLRMGCVSDCPSCVHGALDLRPVVESRHVRSAHTRELSSLCFRAGCSSCRSLFLVYLD